jgi:TrmH family RNA methyltransferase
VGQAAVAREAATGRTCTPIAESLFRSLSERSQPAGLGAIVAAQLADPAQVVLSPADLVVALVGVSDPGNLGTIIRTADSAGARAVVLVGQTTDPFHPGAVKASMGSLFALPLLHLADEAALLAWGRSQGATLVATSAHAAESAWTVQPRWPLMLLLGSEREGVPERLLSAADHRVAIPMWGSATSLNLAVAAGILLFEMRRRQAE